MPVAAAAATAATRLGGVGRGSGNTRSGARNWARSHSCGTASRPPVGGVLWSSDRRCPPRERYRVPGLGDRLLRQCQGHSGNRRRHFVASGAPRRPAAPNWGRPPRRPRRRVQGGCVASAEWSGGPPEAERLPRPAGWPWPPRGPAAGGGATMARRDATWRSGEESVGEAAGAANTRRKPPATKAKPEPGCGRRVRPAPRAAGPARQGHAKRARTTRRAGPRDTEKNPPAPYTCPQQA